MRGEEGKNHCMLPEASRDFAEMSAIRASVIFADAMAERFDFVKNCIKDTPLAVARRVMV